MFQRCQRRLRKKPIGRLSGLIVVLGLVALASRGPALLGQDEPPPAKPANAVAGGEKQQPAADKPANPVQPAPAIRVPVLQLPAVQLPAAQRAPQRVILGRFRGRIGPDGMLAAGEGYAIFPSNREAVRRLDRAGELIAEERMADAFEVLDAILGEAQDFFYQPDRDEQVHRSLKSEARRLIGGLSEEALAQYDLQFGATARQLLDDAVAAGNADGVAAVMRRYFNTQAGFEAAWLLGRRQLDHGQWLAAALTFQTLFDSPRARAQYEPALSLYLATCWVRAGLPSRATSVLGELRKEADRPRIASQEVPLFADDAKAVEWLIAHIGASPEAAAAQLDNWKFHRGNPARNAPGSGGSPLLSTPRWQQTLVSEAAPDADDTMSKQLVDSNEIDLPAETPLAVGEYAVVRSPRWIVGVNLRTGKRIWEYPTWENDKFTEQQQVVNPFTGGPMTIRPHKLATRTTLASDGRAVFVVEDRGGQPYMISGMAVGIRRGAMPAGITLYNKLTARELATEGKLLWEVGGENGEAEPKLAGVYFLGAPLTMGGQLYVIGEMKGEIGLFVIDAASGRLDWSQPLVTVETPVALDSFRRLHGATPSFGDGVMVCPTSAGAVVAVDVANRSLLWGYEYARNQAVNLNLARRSGELSNPFGANSWTDGSVIVAQGRALVTPADSDHMHCIQLIDGKEAWKPSPRNENLYIGGVYRDTILVVGRRQFQGIKLSDGQPAWPPQPLSDDDSSAVPSGRGYLSGSHYYLPLSCAEVIKIDLADGTIKSRVKSRKGYVLGNLVCNQGTVLSLNDDSLDCFFQLDEREQWATETLRLRPDDPEALAMFGEILMDQGKLAEGLVQLERALALAPNDHVRELLIETHLQLLRKDFAGHRARVADIEALLDDPKEKAALAREMALGLHAMGETMAAFDYYVKMCQPGETLQALEPISANEHLVRRDRFVRAKIRDLREAASAAQRDQMDERVEAHLLELGGPANLGALRQLVRFFGDSDSDGSLSAALIERLIEEEKTLEAEWWLLRQSRSPDKDAAAAAYLQLADLMQRLNRPEDAASCYQTLAREFGDRSILGGSTGKQIVESLPDNAPVRQRLNPELTWPKYVVSNSQTPRGLNYSAMPLDVSHGREPFFAHLTLELDSNRQDLLVRDGYGGEMFRVALNDSRRSARTVNYNSIPWAHANGHHVLVQVGTQILAVDALTSLPDGQSRVLWRHDLADLLGGDAPVIRIQGGAIPGARPQWLDQNGRPIGGIWPVGNELVCLQRGNRLLGIDVFSGDILWMRGDIPPAAQVFGDDQYVFIQAQNSSEAQVLRALDGAKIARRKFPSDRFLVFGRKIAVFSSVEGKSRVRVLDAWSTDESDNEAIWQEDFAANARIDSIESDEIAVMDPSGRFVIYSLADERLVVDTKIKPQPKLADVQVVRTPDRYLVVAGQTLQHRPNMPQYSAVQNRRTRSQPVLDCVAYGFERRTGKLLWPAEGDNQVELKNTALLLNQPAHVPVMLFAVNINQRQTRPGVPRVSTGVLCLDIRDGRIVHEETLPNVSTTLVAVADLEQKTLDIRSNNVTSTLTFGDTKPASSEAGNAKADADETQKVSQNAAEEANPFQPDGADPFGPPQPAAPANPFENPFGR